MRETNGIDPEEVIVWWNLSQKTELKSSGGQCAQEGFREEPNCQARQWGVSRQSLGNMDHSFKIKKNKPHMECSRDVALQWVSWFSTILSSWSLGQVALGGCPCAHSQVNMKA